MAEIIDIHAINRWRDEPTQMLEIRRAALLRVNKWHPTRKWMDAELYYRSVMES